MKKLSIIVPCYNEQESLPLFYPAVKKIIKKIPVKPEYIFVNDGSSDDTLKELKKIQQEDKEHVHYISFSRNFGKEAALYAGLQAATGDLVVVMDADLQDDPKEIPRMIEKLEEGYDLVSGWKQKRHDPLEKRLPSKLFNKVTSSLSGVHLHDFNCGLKAYRNEVVKDIEVYGDMHRYIPYLAKNAGYTKIGEHVVQHQARKYGKSKFGISRFFHGYLDLMSLWFLSKFSRRPMHIFGLWGSMMFFIGFIAAIIVGTNKLIAMANGMPYRLVTDSPYFYIALAMMIIGTQLFLTGFLAELVSRSSQDRNRYNISKEF